MKKPWDDWLEMTDVSIFDFLLCKTEGIVGSTSVRLSQLSGRDFHQRLSDLGKASHMIARSDFPPAQWDQEMPLQLLKLFFSDTVIHKFKQSFASNTVNFFRRTIWKHLITVRIRGNCWSKITARVLPHGTLMDAYYILALRRSSSSATLLAEALSGGWDLRSKSSHKARRFLESSLDEEKYQILGIFLSCT